MTTEESAGFTGCRPVFPVTDLDASLSYYVDVLGFSLGWTWPEPSSSERPVTEARTAYVFRSHFELLIRSQSPPVNPVEIVVGMPSTGEVDKIYQEYVAAGAKVVEQPFVRDWGTYEMVVEDPDGHLLRILH